MKTENEDIIEELAETLDYELREVKPFKRTRMIQRMLVKFKRKLQAKDAQHKKEINRKNIELAVSDSSIDQLKMLVKAKDMEMREVVEFVSDIAKLLGEDDLGRDGKSWSIDDFKTAIEMEELKGYHKIRDKYNLTKD